MKWINVLSLINLIGFPLSFLAMYVALIIRPFAWGTEMLLIHAFISIFFTIISLISYKTTKQANPKRAKRLFISVICFLLLPTFFLPFIFNWFELIIWILSIIATLWGIFRIKAPLFQLVFIGSISFLCLVLNFLVAIGHL